MTEKPRHICITGASSGIGQALAIAYAAPGIRLALTGRNEQRLSRVAALCEDKGAIVKTASIDVCDAQALQEWVAETGQKSPIDLMIANAGISGGTGSSQNGEPMDQVRQIMAVNLDGVINTVEAVLPQMMRAEKGQIAVMSSLAGFQGWPGAPAYSASKGAVRMLGEAWRGSLKPCGIKVSTICPGFIRTPMTAINPYKMPFMMDADRAAKIIIKGLEKNKTRIAFPWPTYMFSGMLGVLPGWLGVCLLKKFPSKPLGGE